MIFVLIAIAAVAVVGVWYSVSRGPRQEPGVVSFRRHIDALSPEARREVMDRVRDRPIDPLSPNDPRSPNDPIDPSPRDDEEPDR